MNIFFCLGQQRVDRFIATVMQNGEKAEGKKERLGDFSAVKKKKSRKY